MAQTLGDALTDLSRPRINRSPSPLLALAMPWLVIALGSLSPYWPLVASAPPLRARSTPMAGESSGSIAHPTQCPASIT